MAIQINGTTVVNNSRQLQNIASLDSTTTSTIAAAAGGGGLTPLRMLSSVRDGQTASVSTTLAPGEIGVGWRWAVNTTGSSLFSDNSSGSSNVTFTVAQGHSSNTTAAFIIVFG